MRVAKAAARRVRRVIQKGTVGDGDRAIAVVTNAAAVAGHGERLVIAHHRAIHSQVRAIRPDRVEADAAALVVGKVSGDHAAGVDDELACAVGVDPVDNLVPLFPLLQEVGNRGRRLLKVGGDSDHRHVCEC